MSPAIGSPLRRVDGELKVTGRAAYAADITLPSLAHAVLVTSTIATGRIVGLDTSRAERTPGVVAVLTHLNAPRLPYRPHRSVLDPHGERLHVLQDDVVRFNGQPVAVVVAETLEQAEHAASLVLVQYASAPARLDFEAARREAIVPEAGRSADSRVPADHVRGAPEQALARADVRVDREYRIARQQHNPMEPHATVARWDGDRLTLWDKSQWVVTVRDELAAVFGLLPEQVHVISPLVGGAFGTTLRAWGHVTLAALAARVTGRPVRLTLTRRQMYAGTGHRPETWQRLAVGANREGRLQTIVHEGTGETSTYEQYTERLHEVTGLLYACPHVRLRYRLAPLDTHTPVFMRAPGTASGAFALECALDELAYALRIDPLDLRIRNEPTSDAHAGLPFSSRSTLACYREGAARFGWASRTLEPRSMRDGRWLLGWGMATAAYHTLRGAAGARVRVLADGRAVVESSASDMGPGTYTSLTQVASDALGVAPDRVRVVLGDSTFPYAPSHGGSQTMASVGPAVYAACEAARRRLIDLAVADERSPLHGTRPGEVDAADGQLWVRQDATRRTRYQEVLARAGLEAIDATETVRPSTESERFSMQAFGAVFAEVAVDPDLGLVRMRRLVGAYGAGRIVNPRLALSQVLGGMVGGIGMALLEHTVIDRSSGRVVNATLADYLVPVHADMPALEAIFVEEHDPHVNPLGVKGIGELALVGVAPAIANAVFHATGRRVGRLPITIEQLL
ncbi:acylaldehyde oxidase [Luteitalea sp. TBR-22]|uniref:xanthine dehydrogenase family protein molybdopterin-binding subunit n=1 Tax=Luteitalea sp. TBR-22 TaxID=2802971 RepID=UPI001AFB9DD0|nr:xanthine dehydrogenase family protein molybdopterin-binding subunit [Luteitalea sp. TBR-22]BCS32594.1 acylaldehyde oxidase [Luteitalea sp. TBR-22]